MVPHLLLLATAWAAPGDDVCTRECNNGWPLAAFPGDPCYFCMCNHGSGMKKATTEGTVWNPELPPAGGLDHESKVGQCAEPQAGITEDTEGVVVDAECQKACKEKTEMWDLIAYPGNRCYFCRCATFSKEATKPDTVWNPKLKVRIGSMPAEGQDWGKGAACVISKEDMEDAAVAVKTERPASPTKTSKPITDKDGAEAGSEGEKVVSETTPLPAPRAQTTTTPGPTATERQSRASQDEGKDKDGQGPKIFIRHTVPDEFKGNKEGRAAF